MYSRNYGLGKPWLDKCLKNPISEDLSESSMVNRTKHCSNVNHSNFAHLLINVKAIELEKVSLSNMQNLGTVCEHIDCRAQAFSS